MQPPPQAAPSGVVGPPPVGNPQNVFWSNSTYRRRVNGSTPVAPVTGPLQPVTDPFAFSRQVLQNTSLGGLSKSSPPIMQGPALSQHPGLPAPHTDARDPSRGPREPLPRPFSQPRPDASPPWPVRNSNSDTGPSSGPDVQPTPHPVQHIPGVGPDGSHGGHPHGGMPGPDGPLRRQHPPRGAAAPAASSFFPQPHQQMPDLWGPVQGSPQPSGQQYPPCPDGAVQNAVPLAPGIPHVPPQPAVHQTPGYQQHNPLVSLPGPWASDERNEATYLQSGSHLAKGFEPDNPFGQTPTVGNPWAGQELRQNPGVNQEHLPEPAPVTALAQGNSPENHLHYPLGAGASCAQPEAGLGSLSVFFQGGETENEETLPSEKTGLASKSDFEAFPPSLGVGHPLPPPPVGAGGIYQALLKGSSSEATQQGGDMQPYFPQPAGSRHDRQVPKNAAVDMWGDTASAGVHDAIGPHHENIENLEFLQNQEVLPSEPLGVNSSSLSEPFRSGPEPGLPAAKHGAGNLAGGGGTNLEAPDVAPQPVRSDSVSSSYGSKNHRGLSSSTRPQELLGTFIQQEVGKPEEDVSGSFFKQIDSSPIGGEADETTASPNYRHCLSQPSTPSPPKPIGIFQTSANSSFEPVKSHLVGVKPIEADRANVVGEVRGTRARQKKRKPVAVPPDASPGNLEQPPDNMETLFTPQLCALPPAAALHTAGPPLETVLPAPEKRPPARAQGAAKCESPATTLWAQNELPDFGGNVLLAPAAPALYVPAKPQPSEVIQPPDEGASSHQLQKPGSVPPLQNQDGLGASENLENPPKLGEEEALQSQVTKDMQDQKGLERARQDSEPLQQQASAPHVPQATCSEASDPASPPAQGQSQSSARPPASPAPADTSQQLLSRPPRSSSASVVSTGSSQAAGRSEQPWQHLTPSSALGHPPQDLSYYYYRPLYDAYTAQYPSLYLSDPGTASLYYQDVYGLYEPRYRPYDGSASAYAENYRYPEPERPSSRASHSSDRPPPRQAFPDGYYNAKGGWSSQSDYYANYYSSQYDYGDPSRWDRYHYDSRFRDPRSSDRRYWYGADDDPYRKELFAYGGDRPESDEGRWRYDPRFTGSFDDDPEPPRDPYGDEGDRRSVHSEHSAHSLRSTRSLQSRRSSFSSHSHQSRIYRSHHMPASSCEVPAPPGSFQGDYAYGTYGGNFSPAQGFSEYGYAADTGWPAAQQAPSRPTSPEKFSVPHICARFGPGGQLIKVIPNLPSEGQPALVEVHSMETLLQHTPEQEEMRSFPGPLGKEDTHKVDVINFAQNKATKCFQNENLIDKESASLLWNFIVLLCRQNGTVVGTDIAELLLRDHKTVWLPGKSPNEANLIDFTNEAVEQAEEEESGEAQLSFLTDSQTAATSSLEKETERFRELLLYGRKKDALESAMKNALWGHALLLASKMDSRTHARVMTRFANSLPINDPLQTVYQLMSGRMPAASTCCGDEKWGDWRPHLAMVLSNLNNNMDVESRTMATMGDTLASKGLLDAAHFCYLMAQVGFGVYTKKTTKLVLIGSNHSLPFLKFATNEAIQRTEAYEYAQSLGARTCPLPSFQVFKFIYSCRLAEMGLATQAFHYCEVIAKSILPEPHRFSPVLVSQLVQVALQLRLFDPQLKEKPEEEWFVEPAWLVQLQLVEKQIKEGAVVWRQDGALPQQCPSTPSSEMEQDEGLEAEQPLLALPLPGAEPASRSMLLPPSAPQMLPDGQPANPARAPLFPGPPPPGSGQPGPACRPPVSTLGFPEPSGPDPAALYPSSGVPVSTLPLQGSERLLPEAGQQHPAGCSATLRSQRLSCPSVGTVPQEPPVCGVLSELGEEHFDRAAATLDSQVPPVWECADPPPAASTSTPEVKRPVNAAPKSESKEPKKSGESWFSRWLPVKKRTEAYLPDDKNKSIVWDEKKNQWVNLNEPEEEKKAPPPPPASFPKTPQAGPPGPGGPPAASVNMFSRKAGGARARYVDVLNPSGTQRSEPVLAPVDSFALLAPIQISSDFHVPKPDAETPQASGGAGVGGQGPARGQAHPDPASETKALSCVPSPPDPVLPPSSVDGPHGGQLSRCSSMSSLSHEVSQHFNQAPSNHPTAGGPPAGAVPLYHPAQFAQASRTGRTGQRK
ncbi:protein transport protein Sec16A isoform X6 [Dasypus novemcinctus]|uniref:protein transport protein Sec16A isoform X6 n=1 Tax=Dasypus novemcinctus TaxID=9361 RepID=UPI00265FFB45|nr:protein transport protein Sec16A isoform X8 [Dasypus novemcinctus]